MLQLAHASVLEEERKQKYAPATVIQYKQTMHHGAQEQSGPMPNSMLPGQEKIMRNVRGVLTSRIIKTFLTDSGSLHKRVPEAAAA